MSLHAYFHELCPPFRIHFLQSSYKESKVTAVPQFSLKKLDRKAADRRELTQFLFDLNCDSSDIFKPGSQTPANSKEFRKKPIKQLSYPLYQSQGKAPEHLEATKKDWKIRI